MKKIYFISFLSVLLAFAGNGLAPAYAEINKDCTTVSSESEINVGVLANAENNGSDLTTASEEGALGIMNANAVFTSIVQLTLSIDGRTSMDITGLLRGNDTNSYLDEVRYPSGTRLSYTVQYKRPYYPSDITVYGRGASDINISCQKLGIYTVTFTVTGEGIMRIEAENSASFVRLAVRLNTVEGVGPNY